MLRRAWSTLSPRLTSSLTSTSGTHVPVSSRCWGLPLCRSTRSLRNALASPIAHVTHTRTPPSSH